MATTNHNLLASLLHEAQTTPKRRCFIAYHHADADADADEDEIKRFLDTYSNAEVFTHRALGLDMANDIVDSNDTAGKRASDVGMDKQPSIPTSSSSRRKRLRKSIRGTTICKPIFWQ